MVAAIYARISLDRHDGEGVARQLADCRTEAQHRGWETIEYVDNDVSAYRAKRRPEWERLLADLEAGTVQAIIAYHPDRLYRRLADLERLISAIEAHGAQVVTIRAGDIDLATATGRMTARIIGAVAAAESERTGERVARAKRERAAQGRPAGGGRRPYGLTADRKGIVAAEADNVRTVAAAILAGASIGSQVRWLNARGATTTTGRAWDTAALRRVLTSPHVAGLRAYHGEIVAEAVTPAIIDRDTWDTLRLVALGRRRGRPPGDRWLLTGLVWCANCQRPMYGATNSGHHVYRCAPPGCSRSIAAHLLDTHVQDTVDALLADPAWQAALIAAEPPPTPSGLSGEVEMLQRRRNVLIARWAAGELGDDEYETARQVIADRLGQLEQPTEASPMAALLAEVVDGWRVQPYPLRREVIAATVVCPFHVEAGGWLDGRRLGVGDRVKLKPRWSV